MGRQQPLVVWFKNPHEHSAHYLKFGLMKLARQGSIHLKEQAVSKAGSWLPKHLQERHYRRLVLLAVEWQGQRRLVAVDGEDSPFQLSDVITQVDRYYTCTYCPHLYQERQFNLALPWQDESEIRPYREKFERLVACHGEQFSKVKPWAPIGPELEAPLPGQTWLQRKAGNARHKIQMRLNGTHDWRAQYERFSERWSFVHSLRTSPVTADVVLLDSLWGWPRHRIALHQELANLAKRGYSIRSKLNYRKPEAYELGNHPAPSPSDYPMQVGEPIQGDYERLLAATRIGIFATGFHYGWRNIVTLAWAMGLKTLQDPFTYRFLFDASPFYQTLATGSWSEIDYALNQAREEPAMERQKRCQLFDQIASPERIAHQVVEEIMGELF